MNDRIPSEDELCKSYQVSKTTVRQAINNLVADGYLMKIQGKGTFVTSDQPMVGFAARARPSSRAATRPSGSQFLEQFASGGTLVRAAS